MKVLLINGSPHEQGCTFTALSEIAGALTKQGIDTEMLHIGKKPVRGCVACGACYKTGRCAFNDDPCNAWIDAIASADGLVVGSPVYYAGPNGALLALLDRTFYAGSHRFAHKPATAIVSCRRGGSSAALDRLLKYFTISQMPVVSSRYWNMVHGNSPEEVRRDAEGMQVMRCLGDNMAWMLRGLSASDKPSNQEERIFTNFIR